MDISTLITSEDYAANGSAAWFYHTILANQTDEPWRVAAWDYLTQDRGLHPETLAKFSIGVVPIEAEEDETPAAHDRLRGYISIPYINERGVTTIRFRAMPGSDGPKYLDLPGAGNWLYNVTAAGHGGNTITICEGEVDTMTAEQMGLYAIGLSGVQKWRPHHRHLLEGYSRIQVLCDGDDPGRELGENIKLAMPNSFVQLLPAPEGLDVNSAYLQMGRQGLLDYWGITPQRNVEEE